jgi:hypothetical protein
MNSRDRIVESIIELTDKITSKTENPKNIRIEYSTSKYSSTQEKIWHMVLNGKKITKKSKLLFKYRCLTCSTIHIVSSTQFIRKFNNISVRCDDCKNSEEKKRENQSLMMKNNKIATSSNEKEIIKKELEIIIDFIKNKEISLKLFNDQDDNFKNAYFLKHLTHTEFEKISKNLISLENGKYTDKSTFEFWPVYMSNNQMLFSSVLYDKINKTIFRPNQPILKCDNCDNNWRAKSLNKFKNDIKIYCKDCSLVSKTFNLKPFKNINNEKILYQSKLELKFIKFCNDNNIKVNNGPSIKYIFNDKERTYKVDFQIDENLIEIKDEHIWHKNEISSGKWVAKENAAKKYIEDNKLKEFIFITPKNWNDKTSKLIKI